MFFKNIIFPIYLDYSSTTPVDPRVLEKMLPYFYYNFGNYSSKNHLFGWNSNYFVEVSRIKVSNFLNCDSREIIWTSNSTESNNICIKSISLFYKNKSKHIISIQTEHKSILECLNFLKFEGFDITYLNLKNNGLINFYNFSYYLKISTLLITISYVNNEIGIIQNIFKLSNFCKIKKIFFHLDCSQAISKILINLNLLKIDMLTISAHKIYGPKGISCFYLRRKSNIYFKPIIHGGDQEKKIRPGTLSVPQIIGFGESLSIIKSIFFYENLKIKNFKNIFFYELLKIDSIYLNGDFKYRIPHNLNISFNFIEGESLILSIYNIAISTGSACVSNNLESSYVLKQLNNSKIINNSLRFVFGRFNILSDIYFILKILFYNIFKLRNLSPLL
ncbi:cysteine desulfurase [Candidatus Nasuia deltocephalinicola]|uniref:cysteine desulfurase n=1 Tax=Candidatus Nasuia deltocephalincola TaxID=1160784 RepID=A0A974WR95_9PROT|nr:IscS subfamily cysteine desulfurase [Candidatus Nasuia deltocephalinicola]BEH03873.1 cysteine desulfurase [Candidatus Nasuia deltocephalinicola]